MSEFTALLYGNNTPMDIAEKAAIRALIEVDLTGNTDFCKDYSIENSIAGFPMANASFCIGLNERQ
jgi:hypothetical protein